MDMELGEVLDELEKEKTVESIRRPDSTGDRSLDLSIGPQVTVFNMPGISGATSTGLIANSFGRLGAVPVAEFVKGNLIAAVFKLSDSSSQGQETAAAEATVREDEEDDDTKRNDLAIDDDFDDDFFRNMDDNRFSTPVKKVEINREEAYISLPLEHSGGPNEYEQLLMEDDEAVVASTFDSNGAVDRNPLSKLKKRTPKIAEGEKKKRIRVEWAREEIEAIYDGVAEFGLDFSAILNKNRGCFHKTRTAVKLYDKWRHSLEGVRKSHYLDQMEMKIRAMRLKRMAERAYYSENSQAVRD